MLLVLEGADDAGADDDDDADDDALVAGARGRR